MDNLKVQSIQEILAMPEQKIEYLIKPQILSVGGTLISYGAQESWKSWWGIEMAFALAEGHKFLGLFDVKYSRVLLLQTEQSEPIYRKRLVKFSQNYNSSRPQGALFCATDLTFQLDNPLGIAYLEVAIKRYTPDVIIIDNLYHVVAGGLGDEKNGLRVIHGIDSLREKYSTAFVLLAHPRKTKEEDRQYEDIENLFGWSGYKNWADTVVRLSKTEIEDRIFMSFQKGKNFEQEKESLNVMLQGSKRTARLVPTFQ